MAAELLASAARAELTRLDEGLFLQCFGNPGAKQCAIADGDLPMLGDPEHDPF